MESTIKTFQEALQQEATNNEIEQNKISEKIAQIIKVQDNLKTLSEQPEWPDSFIPVNSLAYIPATIIHTGEQYVTLGTEGQVLMSTNETINFLQRKVDRLKETRDGFQARKEQLDKRNEFFNEMRGEQLPDAPEKITSDVGVAQKTAGGFYEIEEPYVEENEAKFYNKRKAFKKKPQKEETGEKTENADWYFRRLEELERQESEGGDVLSEVQAVLQETSIYDKLSQNTLVRKHCGGTSKDSLNKLIIEALLREPVATFSSIESDEASTNELESFLDSIEND